MPDSPNRPRKIVEASQRRFISASAVNMLIGLFVGLLVARWTADTRLGVFASGLFLGLAIRNLSFALFIPSQLAIEIFPDRIVGPNLWWLFVAERRAIAFDEIDWEETGEALGALLLYDRSGTRIHLRYAWYSEEDRRLISESVWSRQPPDERPG